MLALCFLSKGLENQSSQHLDTRRWFPHTASDSTSFRGKKREHASKPRCGWWTGCFWQAQEKATHSLGRESIHLPMQQNKTNGDSRRRESRKEHHNKVDKHTQLNLFSHYSHLHTVLKWKHSDAEESTWEAFPITRVLVTGVGSYYSIDGSAFGQSKDVCFCLHITT